MSLGVLRVGPLATIQDLGRPGWMHIGVSPSGAADRESHRLANALVGNDPGAATIEVLLGGLEMEALAPTWLAMTGARCGVDVDGRSVDWAAPIPLRAGQRLRLGRASAGLRAYVAVSGGVDVEPVLGSRSRDTLSTLGPVPLRPGEVLPTGPAFARPSAEFAPMTANAGGELQLVVHPGPRADWSGGDLADRPWTISPEVDRVGVRLLGIPLPRHPSRSGLELPSEPLVRGAVQLPPSGLPMVFMADHPVTGGYPVVAVLDDTSCDLLAQGRPGQSLTFRTAPVRR
ncbi:MAG: biotin-dependent carboxyltransferase family protein [Arachnia sp.]